MSQPLDSPVGSLEPTVQALVRLARDRGATPAQREALGGIWADLQAATLAGEDARGLHDRATALAADLLGADALLAPANAPYGGLWQELEAERPPTPTATEPSTADGPRDILRAALEPNHAPSWRTLADAGLTGDRELVEVGAVVEELARALAPGPYLQTMALLPALGSNDRARVAAGESSWALVTGPLVLDLDTATSVAIVGGDGIYELVGADRELLDTRDPTRPLGVVSGGDAGRRLGSSTSLPLIRRRLLVGLAFEAVGLLGALGGPLSAPRALAMHAARLVDGDDPAAELFAAAAKAVAADRAWAAAAAGEAALRERARFARAWEASSAQLRLELGDALLAEEDG